MPPILTGGLIDTTENILRASFKEDYISRYPEGIDLTPGTPQHEKIKDHIIRRAQFSHESMSRRYDPWKELERTISAFIPLNAVEEQIKKDDERKPVPIVVPMTYAAMETLLALNSQLISDIPTFSFEGRGPEDEVGAKKLEQIIQYQMDKTAGIVNLATWLRDEIVYGFGTITPRWITRERSRVRRNKVPTELTFDELLENMIPELREETLTETFLDFEGNELRNIDPFKLLPDPRYAISDIKNMEFIGYLEEDNYMSMLRDEQTNEEIFNVKYLRDLQGISQFITKDSKRDRYDVNNDYNNRSVQSTIHKIYMCIDIVPSDWGLGSGDYPEKWVFGLASDNIVFMAKPLDSLYGDYHIAAISSTSDGYSVSPISRLEVTLGLQKVGDFLVNARMAELRKNINGQWIVNPDVLNVKDFDSPYMGLFVTLNKMYRSNPKALEMALKEIKGTDSTLNHFSDLNVVFQIVERVTGLSAMSQGVDIRSGERRSATESAGVQQGTLSRAARGMQVMAAMGFNPLAEMMAYQTQQYMTEETYVRILGDNSMDLEDLFGGSNGKAMISPNDIDVLFDIVAKDVTMPANNSVQAWTNITQQIVGNPQIAQAFGLDARKIFKYWAKLTGAKNISNFEIKVVPDEFALQQEAAGNISRVV